MRIGRWLTVSVAGLTGLALAGCGQGQSAAPAEDGLQVVATTSILGDITRNVVGDAGSVAVLLEPGTDPHGFEPSAQQTAALREADLVVANGLELVPSLNDGLRAAEDSGVNVLRVAEKVDPVPFDGAGDHAQGKESHENAEGEPHAEGDAHTEGDVHADGEQHGNEQASGALDPHVWLDPVRMAEGVELIGDRVATVAGGQAETVRDSAARYADRVRSTHQRVKEILSDVPAQARTLVTNHDAVGYFAQRYGFEVVGTVIPGGSTLSDPSSGELAELVATIKRAQVPAIFAETTVSTRLAETVSREAGGGIEVVQLYTDSLAPEGEAATYLGMLTADAERIARGLSG
ncbi:metal ABC transporter substrate-binding protein [Amycolatopsis palatopharyngis]|uniref:metal ABC transporter substrate-binding protein n=1 Tax=Amycolatopsis palatopharyngis TaxID=187982 RepID=UPI0013BEA632|nr:metal ABC transporter substrate-binding protein [Amycolatopsis palatopharyngis]